MGESVAFAGNAWVERFKRVASHPNCTTMSLPEQPMGAGAEDNKFERTNLWLLQAAKDLAGAGQLHLVTLWDGCPVTTDT